jgi:hypothetical protein
MDTKHNSRRLFVKRSLLSLAIAPAFSTERILINKIMNQNPAPLKPELVKEFVAKAHGNLERIEELIGEEPALLNAAWDWGGGDFETALNAAGHVGRKDIAEFLLAKGARMDIFCMAMLGELEMVKSLITAYPSLKDSKGPHKLGLIHHAQQGGDQALPVLKYLKSIKAG